MDEKKLEELQKQIEALTSQNATMKADLEKINADYKRTTAELEKSKKATSKATEEAANYKRQLRDTQDEETRRAAEKAEEDARKEAERMEEMRDIKLKLATLETEKRVSTYTAKLMASGYDAQTAAIMAANLPEGVSDDFFTSQKTFIENKQQEAKAAVLNAQPDLSKGTPPKPADPEAAEINKIMAAAGVKGV